MIEILILLVGAHFIADYPLQGDYLAKMKQDSWYHLIAHSGIHAFFVMLITGWWYLAVLEWIAHTITDRHKCKGRLTYMQDQAIHIFCKFCWIFLLLI